MPLQGSLCGPPKAPALETDSRGLRDGAQHGRDDGWASGGRPRALSIRQQVCVLFPFPPSLPGSSGTLRAQPGERVPLSGAFWASAPSPPSMAVP